MGTGPFLEGAMCPVGDIEAVSLHDGRAEQAAGVAG